MARSLFLICAVGACAALVVSFALASWLNDPSMIRSAPDWVGTLHVCVRSFVALAALAQVAWLVWIHRTWARIQGAIHPDDAPSPMKAVGLLLVPLVNIVWQFVVVVNACSLLNDALAKTTSKRRAPTALAVIWCLACSWAWALAPAPFAYVTLLVPLVGWRVTRGIDAALDECEDEDVQGIIAGVARAAR